MIFKLSSHNYHNVNRTEYNKKKRSTKCQLKLLYCVNNKRDYLIKILKIKASRKWQIKKSNALKAACTFLVFVP